MECPHLVIAAEPHRRYDEPWPARRHTHRRGSRRQVVGEFSSLSSDGSGPDAGCSFHSRASRSVSFGEDRRSCSSPLTLAGQSRSTCRANSARSTRKYAWATSPGRGRADPCSRYAAGRSAAQAQREPASGCPLQQPRQPRCHHPRTRGERGFGARCSRQPVGRRTGHEEGRAGRGRRSLGPARARLKSSARRACS